MIKSDFVGDSNSNFLNQDTKSKDSSFEIQKKTLSILGGDNAEIRYKEMQFLFSKKNKEEWLIISDNRNRAYYKSESLKFLEEKQREELVTDGERKFPSFKSSIYIENHQGESFIIIEPLTSGEIDKQQAMYLADFITKYLKDLNI